MFSTEMACVFFTWSLTFWQSNPDFLHGEFQMQQESSGKQTLQSLLHSSEYMPHRNRPDYPQIFLYHLLGLKPHERVKLILLIE